jgi:hypothetical protein
MRVLLGYLKIGILLALAASLSGCYIAPLRWGHGLRGHDGYYLGDQRSDHSRGGDYQRPLPNRQGH